jgi:RHS repeat-associated protein
MPLQASLTVVAVRAALAAIATVVSLSLGNTVGVSSGTIAGRTPLSGPPPAAHPNAPASRSSPVVFGFHYAGPGTNITPSECLTVAVGEDAAYSCGDLRLVQDLPTTTTMSKPRTPRLIYNSRLAVGTRLLPFDYSVFGSGYPFPSATTISLILYGGTTLFSSQPGPTLPEVGYSVKTVRAAMSLPMSYLPTGAYQYQAFFSGGGADNGILALVTRATSPFGPGWWLDGLEQLVPFDSTHELWVGGDGATRLYTKSVGNVWTVQPAVDRPDTLLYMADGTRRRLLPGGAYVRFDQLGRHIETVSETGEHTSLRYEDPRSPWLLTSIVLPVPPGAFAPSYVFTYGLVGYNQFALSSVTAPSVDGRDRSVQISTLPGLRVVRDADQASYSFTLASDGRVTARTDRRGYTTNFEYETGGYTLAGATVDLAGAAPNITHTFCAAEAVGRAACQPQAADTTTLVTTVDGPRTDVNDRMTFGLTRFGAPSRIVDPLGHTTTIVRGNATWPMAVTRIVRANGFTSEAYVSTDRGLVDSTADIDPYGPGSGRAVTRYRWDAKWSKLALVTSPAGVVDTMAYDLTTGRLLWRLRGHDWMRRTSFGYDASTGLLNTVEEPSPENGSPVFWLLGYDGAGNLRSRMSPRGLSTFITRDEIGRVRSTSSPITDVGVSPERRRVQSYVYDLADRVIASTDSAQYSASVVSPEAIHTATTYDANGNPTRVARWAAPDPANIGDVLIDAVYDPANRKIREFDPYRAGDPPRATWTYDAAGNVVTSTRGGTTIWSTYDALNRVVSRNTPELASPRGAFRDEQRFGYDETGNVTDATNFAAEVSRLYYPNGAISTEVLNIAQADLNFGSHVYTTSYSYDLAGRRTVLTPPTTAGLLAPVVYGYDPETGALASVEEIGSPAFHYEYNTAGMLASLTAPDGTVEERSYDADGRQLLRTENSPVAGALHYDAYSYDGRGNITMIQSTTLGIAKTSGFGYDGLGVVIGQSQPGSIFSFTGDAFGNAVRAKRNGPMETSYRYTPHTMQMTFGTTPLLDGWQADTVTQDYNITGDLASTFEVAVGPVVCSQIGGGGGGTMGTFSTCPGGGTLRVNATKSLRNSYNGDGRLVQSRKTTSNDNSAFWYPPNYQGARLKQVYPEFERGVLEQFRYDALGRRVWTRADRRAFCPGAHERDSTPVCVGTIERTVYDGDQAILEIRQPGDSGTAPSTLESDEGTVFGRGSFGVVGYVNGARIDQPLMIARTGEPKSVAHYNWQGRIEFVTNVADGRSVQCGVPSAPPTGYCVNVRWPATTMTFGMVATDSKGGPGWWWWGTTVNLRQNASGGLDMRNRVYDPETGRFTQEDPIGLAGGLNLYGFAGGDAVNFSDPFGLCPPTDDNTADCAPGSAGWYANRLANGEGNSALNWAGGLLATCNESFLCQGALFAASFGASAVETAAARGGIATVRLGQAGEAAVRGAANIGEKIAIRVGERTRIPDGLTSTVLTEVKNVKSLSFTRQLRDFAQYAEAHNLRFDLWVRQGARISGPLQRAIELGSINLRIIP